MVITIEHLERCFNAAKENGAKYVGVTIDMGGFQKPEVIINPYENIEDKLSYYKKTYDENLKHKYSPDIRITGCTYGNDFQEIEVDLLGVKTC